VSLAVYFHPDAENEMNEAAEFLDRQCPGLGIAFLAQVRQAVDTIRSFPEAGRLLEGQVRRKLVVKFPYSVVYSIRSTQIRVLAVAHHKRRPYYWRSRG
jgi:plasmid stabilization system protein ParE